MKLKSGEKLHEELSLGKNISKTDELEKAKKELQWDNNE